MESRFLELFYFCTIILVLVTRFFLTRVINSH